MKSKIKIILISVLVIVVIFIIIGFTFYNYTMNELSGNIKLNTDEYLTAVEVDSKSNFILFINKNKKISNIIFLNDYSIKSLYKEKIEGKNIEKGIELIVDKLKNDNEFTDTIKFQLIDYGNNSIYEEIKEEFNKEFVIYGINKDITGQTTTLEEKLINLGYESSNSVEDNLRELYNISLDLIGEYRSSGIEESKVKEEDISLYATNIYNKLASYGSNITNQAKDSTTGIDITTINATGDYQNELYATNDSWYYIENGQVFADIKFEYSNAIYEYCFRGTTDYTKGTCN